MAQERELRELAKVVRKKLKRIYGNDMAFMLNIAQFNETNGISDYISNGTREDCISWMKETIIKFERQEDIPASKGEA